MKTKQVKILLNRGKGRKELLVLPLIQETSTGYVCGHDETFFGQAKGEWFPKESGKITVSLI